MALAKQQLASCTLEGTTWYWPADENPRSRRYVPDEQVRLLAPFDPVVWDRRRFELLWDWVYKFEAYTPAPKRQYGYYALPVLWHDQVVGWANLSVREGELVSSVGYAGKSLARDKVFRGALEDELQRMAAFL